MTTLSLKQPQLEQRARRPRSRLQSLLDKAVALTQATAVDANSAGID